MKVSQSLLKSILNAGVTRYEIAKTTGVDEAALSRFVNGTYQLKLQSVDKLATYLHLELRRAGRTTGKAKGGR
jgi:transcriptional regulator with XRE-family HTH domain